jgi:tRNA pseudouridine55 synthase
VIPGGGEALGVGGHLTALRRTRVGRFGLDQARTLDDLAEQPSLSHSLDEACLQSFPHRDLSDDEAEDTRHGRPLKPAGIDGAYAATAPDGRVIALLRDEASRTKSVVVLRPGQPSDDLSGSCRVVTRASKPSRRDD